MIKLEQLRSELLDRFERADRRFAQYDQRLARIEQRAAELGERLELVLTAVRDVRDRDFAGKTREGG